MHGRRPIDKNKLFCLFFQYTATVKPEKLYTRKELGMTETYIADLSTRFYITEIKNLEFHLPHVRILGTNHCGNTWREELKCCSAKKDVLCNSYYSERVVDSFAHQINSEYYGINIYMCLLKALHWSTLVHQHIKKQQEQQKHAHTMLFSFIFFDNRKHDSATTNLHRKYIIELLKQHNIMTNTLSKIWGNAYGCAELYICVTALYLMSILSQDFYVIIDRGISAPGNGRELVYGLNSIRICFSSN